MYGCILSHNLILLIDFSYMLLASTCFLRYQGPPFIYSTYKFFLAVFPGLEWTRNKLKLFNEVGHWKDLILFLAIVSGMLNCWPNPLCLYS